MYKVVCFLLECLECHITREYLICPLLINNYRDKKHKYEQKTYKKQFSYFLLGDVRDTILLHVLQIDAMPIIKKKIYYAFEMACIKFIIILICKHFVVKLIVVIFFFFLTSL